jgi:hypothetical protein
MKYLVIFDFSGTLSIEAVLFGRDENLCREFKLSGLWQIGLQSSEIFWSDVIAPTWQQGATTPIGYAALLTTRLASICDQPETVIARCAAAFADRYFTGSCIHLAWVSLLRELVEHPDTLVLIATDHYADATGHILNQLKRLDIPGASFSQTAHEWHGDTIVIANSADVGTLKATAEFWHRVKDRLALETLSSIVLVDDFGWNESSDDRYAAAEKITTRKQATEDVLSVVFGCPVRTVPFLLQHKYSAQENTLMREFQASVNNIETSIKEVIV